MRPTHGFWYTPQGGSRQTFCAGDREAQVMILVDRMWKKLPPDHPTVYREPAVVFSAELYDDGQAIPGELLNDYIIPAAE
jgi:hypothetical protein